MEVLLPVIKAIAGFFILMLIGVNLLGMVVRGMVRPLPQDDVENLALSEGIKSPISIFIAIAFALITLLYFYLLFHFWNIGVALAAIIIMLSRFPDLLFEIKTGKKIAHDNMPKRTIDIICSILYWLALPLLWYSFYNK